MAYLITVDCLRKWLSVRMSCPLCNTQLVLAQALPTNAPVSNNTGTAAASHETSTSDSQREFRSRRSHNQRERVVND